MVVGCDGQQFDTRVHKELGEYRLELRLPGLEVIITDGGLLALGELDDTTNERVLGCTVDERFALEGRSDGKQGDTSECEERIEARRQSVVSFTPGLMSL